jgi:hypothetical protein
VIRSGSPVTHGAVPRAFGTDGLYAKRSTIVIMAREPSRKADSGMAHLNEPTYRLPSPEAAQEVI